MTIKTILKRARLKIMQGWTQGYYARTATSAPVSASSQTATCWCLLGALSLAQQSNDEKSYRLFQGAVAQIARVIGTDLVSQWNDAPERTQAEVVSVLDRAIASCGAVKQSKAKRAKATSASAAP